MIIRQKFKDFFNLNDNPRVDQMIYDQKEAEREKTYQHILKDAEERKNQ